MAVFDITTPVGTEAKSLGDDRIRELKVAVQDALQADGGVFPGPAPLTSPVYYPVILRDVGANKPAASVNYPGRMFVNTDTGMVERLLNDGSAWTSMAKGLHVAEQTVASVAGVVTLNESGDAYLVTGTETVNQIAGWSAGVVVVRWASARIVQHDGVNVSLRGGVSRNVDAGDIHVFQFSANGKVRELGFTCLLGAKAVGETFMWPSNTVPVGALECNGASQLRTAYPGLFSVIGTAFGTVDASHFNLPDMRGQFPRGWDHGAGNDPDAASRVVSNTGGATGDNVGSKQADAFASHTHTETNNLLNFLKANGSDAVAGNQQTVNTGATGGNETRPKNVNLMFCIKY